MGKIVDGRNKIRQKHLIKLKKNIVLNELRACDILLQKKISLSGVVLPQFLSYQKIIVSRSGHYYFELL